STTNKLRAIAPHLRDSSSIGRGRWECRGHTEQRDFKRGKRESHRGYLSQDQLGRAGRSGGASKAVGRGDQVHRERAGEGDRHHKGGRGWLRVFDGLGRGSGSLSFCAGGARGCLPYGGLRGRVLQL